MTSEPGRVAYKDVPEVGGLWATPPDWDGESAIVYLYGGGYVISSPHSRLARLLAWQVRLQSRILRGSVDGPPICEVDNRPSGAYTAGNVIKRRSAESPGGTGERGTHQWPFLWPRGESPAFASVGFSTLSTRIRQLTSQAPKEEVVGVREALPSSLSGRRNHPRRNRSR